MPLKRNGKWMPINPSSCSSDLDHLFFIFGGLIHVSDTLQNQYFLMCVTDHQSQVAPQPDGGRIIIGHRKAI
jgi:hypothetical protein